jgi:hypothetical protein
MKAALIFSMIGDRSYIEIQIGLRSYLVLDRRRVNDVA